MEAHCIMPDQPKPKVQVTIQRNPDDPICPRISMGGKPEIGYYLTFRGDPLDIALMLEACAEAFKEKLSSGEKFEGGFHYQ